MWVLCSCRTGVTSSGDCCIMSRATHGFAYRYSFHSYRILICMNGSCAYMESPCNALVGLPVRYWEIPRDFEEDEIWEGNIFQQGILPYSPLPKWPISPEEVISADQLEFPEISKYHWEIGNSMSYSQWSHKSHSQMCKPQKRTLM